eukprot:tig00021257_g19752.t1
MVAAWFFVDDGTSQFEEHRGAEVTLEDLRARGVLYWQLDADRYEEEGKLEGICKERNYKNRDQVTITPEMQGFDDKMKMFFEEHLHDDEEIRFVMDGSGYFDVRGYPDERWIRVAVEKGDMLVLPAGIYHRFTVDARKSVKAMRLFQDEPKWVAISRPAAESAKNAARQRYIEHFSCPAPAKATPA